MRLVFILLIIFSTLISFSQNYSGMYPGSMHFYSVNGSNTLTSIREDSSYFNGTEFVKVPELLLRDVWQENIVDSSCSFWGGQECLYKMDAPTILGKKIISGNNQIKQFNFYGDSLTIDFSIPVGDTQLTFQSLDTNLRLKFICLAKDSSTIFGLPDSIIIYSVIVTDTLNNILLSPFNGDTIIYSKNVGLYRGFSFDYFPITYDEIELKGIRNPNYGFYGLTNAEIYDYQIGDKFEIYLNYPPGPYTLNEILNRTDSPTNVEYSILQIIRTSVWDGNGYVYNYDTSIIQRNYSKTSFIDEYYYYYKGYKLDTSIFNGCISGIFYEGNNYNSCMNYCPTQNCYGSADCFMITFLMEQYLQGVGLIYGTYNTIGGSYAWQNLTFFEKQGLDCGSSYVLSNEINRADRLIEFFPNPTLGILNIKTENNFENGQISITDIFGREILQFPFENQKQIDLSNFSDGIYFVRIFSADVLLNTQKLIKQ